MMNNVPSEFVYALGYLRIRVAYSATETLRRLRQNALSPDASRELLDLELLYLVSIPLLRIKSAFSLLE